jgi:hypothetical protein
MVTVRFNNKTATSFNDKGCKEWISSLSKNGYGRFFYKGKSRSAHRVSYELFIGTIPENMSVLHKCDNRKCVNPEHLFIGNAKDNALDRRKKGRSNRPVGVKNPKNKLSIDQVTEIRLLLKESIKVKENYSKNFTIKAIARKFNVSEGAINLIRSNKNWRK